MDASDQPGRLPGASAIQVLGEELGQQVCRLLKYLPVAGPCCQSQAIRRPAPVAQRIEHPPSKRRVAGSIPAWGTNFKIHLLLLVNAVFENPFHISTVNCSQRVVQIFCEDLSLVLTLSDWTARSNVPASRTLYGLEG